MRTRWFIPFHNELIDIFLQSVHLVLWWAVEQWMLASLWLLLLQLLFNVPEWSPNLSDSRRLITSSEYNGGLCDKTDYMSASSDWSGPGWYRFPDTGKLPETPPSRHRCNTDAPGWLNGSHPTILEGLKQAEVCFNWETPCDWSVDVTIENCGTFYVYYLQEVPYCVSRYCYERGLWK